MTNIIKQTVGIDCSMKTLDCSFGTLSNELKQDIQTSTNFSNTPEGFEKLIEWAGKRRVKALPLVFVVEATGVYHELLANYLVDNDHQVSIVLPNRTSNFFRTTRFKTITDASAARMIAQFGLEKELELWKKPNALFNVIRQLTREREQLIAERSSIKNQVHAESSGAYPHAASLKRMNERIKLLNKQIEQIEAEIAVELKQDVELKRRIDNLCTIDGVGLITAVAVVAETNGFDLFRNKKQLVSYAGLDIIEKQSGSSVRSATRISKRGNRYIRKALYFPAFTAIRCNPTYKSHYASLVAKHGIKMKAAVSVQRKLLVLMHTIWKKNEPFVRNYQKESGQQSLATPTELD